MKKNILTFIFLIFSFSSIFANPLDDDCLYLESLFSNVAIDMSLALEEKNLTTQNVIDDIKSIYKDTASSKVEKKDGIDRKAFASAISEVYAKYAYKNGHASIFDVKGDNFFVPFEPQLVYYSDVFFTKENDSYIVYENYKKIKKGMHYTGNTDNLLKTVHNNQTLFRFCTFSPTTTVIKNTMISVENKEYKIRVFNDIGSLKERKDYDFQKIDDNTIYLKIEKNKYTDDEVQEKQFFNDSEKIIKEFKNADSIIFDFRNNLGGTLNYLTHFLQALIYDKKTKENDLEFTRWHSSLFAGEKRINTKMMINKAIGRAPSDYINYYLENLDKKYLIDEEYENVAITPWYKGKIYILINPLTCSAPERFILDLKNVFSQNVIVVGQNSLGSLDFSDAYDYLLPNSKIELRLCAVDYRDILLLNTEKCWHGETFGIFPDYWCIPQDIVSLLSYLTGNNNLEEYVKL